MDLWEIFKIQTIRPSMVAHACNSSTQEAEAEGSQIQSQWRLHNETPFQNKQTNKTDSNYDRYC
jgi:hypothetical protein